MLSVQAAKICEDQIRQHRAVAAFKNAEGRHAEFADALAEPLEVFGFQCFLRQRVVCIGVETGRNRDQVGFEFFHSTKRAFENFPVLLPWSVWSDGKV